MERIRNVKVFKGYPSVFQISLRAGIGKSFSDVSAVSRTVKYNARETAWKFSSYFPRRATHIYDT